MEKPLLLKSIQKYLEIQALVRNTNVSSDETFQRKFCGFYRVRRNKEWKKSYFDLFEQAKTMKELSFSYILNELYKRTGRIEASFASKMLATLNTDMPVWDRFVLKNLNTLEDLDIKLPTKSGEEKINKVIDLYEKIVKWYQSDKAKSYLFQVNETFSEFDLSDIKKIDFHLWSIR